MSKQAKGKAPEKGKRNALGRGLSALMSPTVVSVEKRPASKPSPQPAAVLPLNSGNLAVAPQNETAFASVEEGLIFLPLDEIAVNSNQPRQFFDQTDLEALAKSIKETGLLQPIVVRPAARGEKRYQIVAGERRYRASLLCGLTAVPAIIREVNDHEALALAIVENVQRTDLNPIEEAAAFRRLIDEFGETQETVAFSVGKDRVSVANALRLLKLAPSVQELIIAGKISAGHGRALLMFEAVKQPEIAKKIIADGLSVRAVEQLGAAHLNDGPRLVKKTREHPPSPATQELEDRFRRALGTKVSLSVSEKGAGELRIAFYSQAELENLIERLGA